MSLEKKLKHRVQRRKNRVRQHLQHDRPRVSVFRSLSHIYAQVINDNESKTVAGASSLELKQATGDKKQIAREVGLELARRARASGITTVAFDRGSSKYHGRVKALAEGLREGGLEF